MSGPTLVDTSVWVDHLRTGSTPLSALLNENFVFCHPMVIGELACGQLQRRREILGWLGELPQSVAASHEEVLALIDRHGLAGRGLGWVDAHLLAATLLTPPVRLWTRDRRLRAVARALGVHRD